MSQSISIATTGEKLAVDVRWARSPREKMRGLLGRSLRVGEALIIERARQVHTIGMSYPIDVLFCDDAWRVRHLVRSMRSGRITRWVGPARFVIELPAGTIPATLRTGMQIVVATDSGDVVHPR